MKQLRKRFRGLYWRQMFVVVGMVLLTLSLLGASFFALSYNYARNQKTAEIESSDGLITKKLKINLLQIQLLLRPKSLYPGMSIWETGE